jgi:high affinity Mn2+ porin
MTRFTRFRRVLALLRLLAAAAPGLALTALVGCSQFPVGPSSSATAGYLARGVCESVPVDSGKPPVNLDAATDVRPEESAVPTILPVGGAPPGGGPVPVMPESKPDTSNGNNGKNDKNGDETSEKKPSGPRTAPQAIAAYYRSLCVPTSEEYLRFHFPQLKKKDEGEKKKSNGKNGDANGDGADQAPPEGDDVPPLGQPRGERSVSAFGDAPFEEGDGKEPEPEWYSAHMQGTIVTQKHGQFTSPYMSNLSLIPHERSATSETATLYYDARLWECDHYSGEVVFNPEIAGGTGFSGSNGVAGFPNGEITRVGIPAPTPYIARLYYRQTVGLGGETEKIDDDPNQIAGTRDIDRITIVIGKFTFTDLVDDNRYSHDPRTQFLPWSFMYNGAWDYPANVRGYSYGMGIELNQKTWALRYGMMHMPLFANAGTLDWSIKGFGYVLEFEKRYSINEHPGKVRLMSYLNHAKMGNYMEAIIWSPVNPDVTATRSYRYKYGFCLSWEQEIDKNLGMWARLGWNDGQSESFAFTPIDRTLTFGWLLRGASWNRKQDTVGFGLGFNGLSSVHREYLAAGGQDFNLGDGALNYRPESILESFYNWQIRKGINITLDGQGIANPAYNHDRGPVAVGTVRAHFEY